MEAKDGRDASKWRFKNAAMGKHVNNAIAKMNKCDLKADMVASLIKMLPFAPTRFLKKFPKSEMFSNLKMPKPISITNLL